MAEFHGVVISWATDYDELGLAEPSCPKCKSEVRDPDHPRTGRCDRLALPGLQP